MFFTVQRKLWVNRILAAAFVLTVLAALGHAFAAQQVCRDTVRLHILANSDTLPDQLLKLQVRDAVLDALPAALATAPDAQAAADILQANLPRLQSAAQAALRKAHSGQTVQLRLEHCHFDARDYGTFALPAGQYTALRVELGRADGHNWFCVVYPALCLAGATPHYATGAQNALVFGRYQVRLAAWDALQKALHR